MTKINRIFDFLRYPEEEDYVLIIDEEKKCALKLIIDLLDDSPVQDIPKWKAQDIWFKHEQEIRREGGFMQDD